jgi:hypothetical protein
MKRPLKWSVLYLESDPKADPKLFASEVESGSEAQRKMKSSYGKIVSDP